MLLGDRGRAGVVGVRGDDEALLVEVGVGGRRIAYGLGEPARARALLAGLAWAAAPDRVSLPRLGAGPAGAVGAPAGERPAPHEDLPGALAEDYAPVTAWDWFALARADAPQASPLVERLDPGRDAELVRECLAEANPSTEADPAAPGEAAWFGVREDGRLVGVIGATARTGEPAAADVSWHLHGLGVRPAARRRGLGAALTASAAVAAFDAGADWVSLGMYASNDAARAVYDRLGFVVDARFSSYRRRVR